jgi:hypothetical protein
MKRYIREAYRQHKAPFYTILETKEKQCALAIVFTGKKIIENALPQVLTYLVVQKRYANG